MATLPDPHSNLFPKPTNTWSPAFILTNVSGHLFLWVAFIKLWLWQWRWSNLRSSITSCVSLATLYQPRFEEWKDSDNQMQLIFDYTSSCLPQQICILPIIILSLWTTSNTFSPLNLSRFPRQGLKAQASMRLKAYINFTSSVTEKSCSGKLLPEIYRQMRNKIVYMVPKTDTEHSFIVEQKKHLCNTT